MKTNALLKFMLSKAEWLSLGNQGLWRKMRVLVGNELSMNSHYHCEKHYCSPWIYKLQAIQKEQRECFLSLGMNWLLLEYSVELFNSQNPRKRLMEVKSIWRRLMRRICKYSIPAKNLRFLERRLKSNLGFQYLRKRNLLVKSSIWQRKFGKKRFKDTAENNVES